MVNSKNRRPTLKNNIPISEFYNFILNDPDEQCYIWKGIGDTICIFINNKQTVTTECDGSFITSVIMDKKIILSHLNVYLRKDKILKLKSKWQIILK